MASEKVYNQIFKIMSENNISIRDLNNFAKGEQANMLVQMTFGKTSSKWGDDAVDLEEDENFEEIQNIPIINEVKTISTQTELFVQIENEKVLTPTLKSINIKKNENKNDCMIKSESIQEIKLSSDKELNSWKDVTAIKGPVPVAVTKTQIKNTIIQKNTKNIDVIYTLQDFIDAIKNKKKMYLDFEIADEAHCPHTFEGTLCPNVRQCGMIHLQRCIHNLNCQHKHCAFLHVDDMPTEEAQENFMNTMDKYNYIKNNKKNYRS